MNRRILFFCIILFITIYSSLVFAQDISLNETNNETNTSVEYDPEIVDAFNNQTWLPVIVRLVDNSNITITGTKEERRNLSRQRDEWFEQVSNDFLASLPENDFDGERMGSNGFVGFITKNGFYWLLNNSKVKKISWTKYGAQASLENKSKSDNVSEIEKEPEFKIINNVSISKNVSIPEEISESEEKIAVWLWMVTIIIILGIIFYLIIKFRKK